MIDSLRVYRARAKNLKVGKKGGGPRLKKEGDQGSFKTTCFAKKWGRHDPPQPPSGAGPGSNMEKMVNSKEETAVSLI